MSEKARHQALLSEYKGNLFEFLVARALSVKLGNEFTFLKSLSTDFKKMLQIQEGFIREFYSELLVDLPILANNLSDEIINTLKLNTKNITDIVIVGKAALASQNDSFAEADIILKGDSIFPISLKLSKANAYVNTKSAGLKSFFSKYFSRVSKIENTSIDEFQNQFNQSIEMSLDQFKTKIFQANDIPLDKDFTYWVDSGLPSLSGELEGVSRQIYLELLYNINHELYKNVKFLFENVNSELKSCLLPLMGFGDSNIIQATAYYNLKDKNYVYSKALVESIEVCENIEFRLENLKETAANFEISAGDRILQLRVKAMNKFTNKSFKINCAVKVIS